MKTFLLACFIAGVLLVEGSGRGRDGWKKKRFCKKLEKGCEYGIRKITYCAYDNATDAYVTVEKPAACLLYAIKCSENKDQAPLHKGECGNCTQANVCRGPAMKNGGKAADDDDDDDDDRDKGGKKWGRKICASDGNEYNNMCEFAVARCEAYNNQNHTKLFPESCRKAKLCEKLEEKCSNGSYKHNVTYCAWNSDNAEYETVTKGVACLMHAIKCGEDDGDKLPLHKGECGNCTKANICRKPGRCEYSQVAGEGMMGGVIDNEDDDDDDDDNDSVTAGGRVRRGYGQGRGHGGGKKSNGGRMGQRWRKNRKENKGGKRHHKKRKGRKICDQDGNEYDNMCDFGVARCEKYAGDDKEIKPARCPKDG